MSFPLSTYRIQLHAGFTFQQLEGMLDYLQELGISTIYASPVTTATKGSQHGYDVTDALALNPEIGTEQEWERLANILKIKSMSWLQDIVPNHMAFENNNTWLHDVLERGKDSPYYRFFDIDTYHSTELLGEKIMVPFLGKTLTECLQEGELQLAFKDGFVIQYYDKEFPVSISSYQWICTIAEGCPPELLSSLQHLEQSDWPTAKEKWIEQTITKEEWMPFLQQRIGFINEKISLLSELLNNQHYVLTHGTLASSRINYRRFFTVNSLICLRMEDPIVFSVYHEKIRKWMQKGYLQGLRIDHIDGLAYPRSYVGRLRSLFGKECYIVAEKILTGNEQLPDDWPLQGTTGYDFLSMINQLMTDENGYKELQDFYRERVSDTPPYEEIIFAKKHTYLKTQMGGEWNNLVDLLLSLPLLSAEKMNKDRLKEALGILMASFPVYRVYPELTSEGISGSYSNASRNLIDRAFATASGKMISSSPELEFLEALFRKSGDPEINKQKVTFQTRLMQFTGPLAAKGIEDTTFYTYNPLIARNEVGDSPGIVSLTSAEFHQKLEQRCQSWPHTMNATATHDTKRGEDSRIRLCWLTAVPTEWIEKVKKWNVINHALLMQDGPSLNDEYLIYQCLLGSFPMDLLVTDHYRERLQQYLTKALREAKTNTSWETPNEAYERKCQSFLNGILQPESAFLEDFIPFAYKVIHGSVSYCLSQLLAKLTAPGIPDMYQGSECWDLSLVDPDNRTPVDYVLRKNLLEKIKGEEKKGASAVLNFITTHRQQGAEKLFTIYRVLSYRNQHPQIFMNGEYIPVEVAAPLLCYIRRHGSDWALIMFPLVRKGISLPETFTITLPSGAPSEWVNQFTGDELLSTGSEARMLECKGLLQKFPVVLLTSRSSS